MRRISIATRISVTFDLVMATPMLAPAVLLAFVLALGLALAPAHQSWIGAAVHGGIGLRVVVLVLILMPLAILTCAYRGATGTRRQRAEFR